MGPVFGKIAEAAPCDFVSGKWIDDGLDPAALRASFDETVDNAFGTAHS